jgi:hypothetical protein
MTKNLMYKPQRKMRNRIIQVLLFIVLNGFMMESKLMMMRRLIANKMDFIKGGYSVNKSSSHILKDR